MWLGAGIGIGVLGVLSIQCIQKRAVGVIQGKITPEDSIVRRKAIEVASKHPGEYNIEQVFDVFDYIKSMNYVSDPEPDYVAFPRDTILAGGGDCDDFAVTTASLIKAIGSHARVAVVHNDRVGHAFSEVYIGTAGTITASFLEPIRARYGDVQIAWEYDERGDEWLIFDTLLSHPGMLPDGFVVVSSETWTWMPGVAVHYYYD